MTASDIQRFFIYVVVMQGGLSDDFQHDARHRSHGGRTHRRAAGLQPITGCRAGVVQDDVNILALPFSVNMRGVRLCIRNRQHSADANLSDVLDDEVVRLIYGSFS